MAGDAEVEVIEEVGDASEETDAFDAAGFGLIEEGVDEQAAGSVSFGLGTNGDGTDLGEVRAIDVESGAAEELAGAGFNDGEGVDVLADLRVTPGKQGSVVGEAMDQLVDGAGVVNLRYARPHGGCGELVFCVEERVCEGGRERGSRRFLYEGQCHRTLRFSSLPGDGPEGSG